MAALLAFGLATDRPLLQRVLGSTYPGLDATGWKKLTSNSALFFDASGVRTYLSSGPVTREILTNGIKGALAHGGSPGSASPVSLAPSPTGS